MQPWQDHCPVSTPAGRACRDRGRTDCRVGRPRCDDVASGRAALPDRGRHVGRGRRGRGSERGSDGSAFRRPWHVSLSRPPRTAIDEPLPWNEPVLVAAAEGDEETAEAPLKRMANHEPAPVPAPVATAAPQRVRPSSRCGLGRLGGPPTSAGRARGGRHKGCDRRESRPAPRPLPQPTILHQGLEDLSCECETGLWAMEVLRQIDKLLDALSVQSPDAGQVAARLSYLVDVSGAWPAGWKTTCWPAGCGKRPMPCSGECGCGRPPQARFSGRKPGHCWSTWSASSSRA